jgi:hypothetical protein
MARPRQSSTPPKNAQSYQHPDSGGTLAEKKLQETK